MYHCSQTKIVHYNEIDIIIGVTFAAVRSSRKGLTAPHIARAYQGMGNRTTPLRRSGKLAEKTVEHFLAKLATAHAFGFLKGSPGPGLHVQAKGAGFICH